MRGPFQFLFGTLMWIPGLALAVSFLGALHPIGDSIAVFRQLIIAALAALSVAMVFSGGRFRGFLGIVISVAAAISTLPSATQRASGGQEITVYQKNLLLMMDHTKRLEDDIRAHQPDIVTLQEIHPRNRHILNNLRDIYPYQHVCAFLSDGAIAVLSRWPAEGPVLPCSDANGLAAMLVDTGGHRIWVGSVHLRWPWPYPQARQVSRIEERIAPLHQPLILGGDFNMVHWSHTLRRLARQGGLRLAGAAGPTFKLPQVPITLAIDHVFMPVGARAAKAETRPAFGSDHLGVLSVFELP